MSRISAKISNVYILLPVLAGVSLIKNSSGLDIVISMAKSKSLIQYDLVIRNVRVIDGTGTPWFRSDIGIIGSVITKLGKIGDEEVELAKVVIEGDDKFLAPGFIDSHTHDDVALFLDPSHTSKTLQGVTTIITGNCGFSNYPDGNNAEVQSHLSSLLGDIDPSSFFENFTGYKEKLSIQGLGTNVASLVGHGPLRISVMGYENREATVLEIEAMCELLEAQLIQGSIGLSLGLVYPPSAYAKKEELIALAKVVAKHDRVISAHIRSYEGNLLSSIQEYLEILKESNAKGLLSHLQVAGTTYWGTLMTQALEMLEEARDSGVDVTVDMYPYLAGSSSILQLLPPSSMSGGFEELEEKLLNDPEYYQQLENLTEHGTEPGWESKIALIGWENVVINSVESPDLVAYEIEGLNMHEGMLKLGYSDEFSFCIMVVLADKGRSNIIMFQQFQDDQNQVFKSRLQMVGSDSIPRTSGKPHPRMFGTFPKVVGRMTQHDRLITIEEAVRKSTSMTATRFGILDRGLLRVGMAADLVLFTENILDEATYEDPTRSPTGIEGVWVNGVRVVNENGEPYSELPGVVIISS